MSAPQTLRPGRYCHFKGREYELLFVATHSETLEPMVVYRALYGERFYLLGGFIFLGKTRAVWGLRARSASVFK